MQPSHIVALGETSPEFAELMRLLNERYAVIWAQSMADIERAAASPPALIIAERRRLQWLNFEAVSALIQDSGTLWMLLDNGSFNEDGEAAFLSRMYYVIPVPYAPPAAYRLAVRAIEHARLVREHERLVQHVQDERRSPARAAECAAASQSTALPESVSSEAYGSTMSSEKFAMLGQMLAGIAHEINTPAGAINAAAGNLQHHLRMLLESAREMGRTGMTLEAAQTALRMLANMLKTLEETPRRHSEEIRNEQKALTDLLKQRNLPNAARLAREIARLDLSPWLDDALALFQADSPEPLLTLLTSWHHIIYSVQDIHVSNDVLTRMVRAVKSYAYPWQDRQELADIQESLDIALTLLANKFKQNIRLTTVFVNLPPILCRPSDLTHVWVNLLHNAIQAIDGEGEIRLETFVADAFIGVRVTDTGQGIPPDILPQIFAPNFTTKPREEGTGLGLYLVRQILDKHHGTIEVSSVPGQTTFEVRLPR